MPVKLQCSSSYHTCLQGPSGAAQKPPKAREWQNASGRIAQTRAQPAATSAAPAALGSASMPSASPASIPVSPASAAAAAHCHPTALLPTHAAPSAAFNPQPSAACAVSVQQGNRQPNAMAQENGTCINGSGSTPLSDILADACQPAGGVHAALRGYVPSSILKRSKQAHI